jgi:hypothetical protein
LRAGGGSKIELKVEGVHGEVGVRREKGHIPGVEDPGGDRTIHRFFKEDLLRREGETLISHLGIDICPDRFPVDRVHRILSNPLKELLHRPPLKVHIPHPTPEIEEIPDNEKKK